MKIIRHTARDMRQALRAVREQLGEDAVILSSRRTGEGVEVTAAVDFDASTLEAGGFSGAPTVAALPAPTFAAPPASQSTGAARSAASTNSTVLALTTPRGAKAGRTEAASPAVRGAAPAGDDAQFAPAPSAPSYDALAALERPPTYTPAYDAEWISEAARQAVAEYVAAPQAPLLAPAALAAEAATRALAAGHAPAHAVHAAHAPAHPAPAHGAAHAAAFATQGHAATHAATFATQASASTHAAGHAPAASHGAQARVAQARGSGSAHPGSAASAHAAAVHVPSVHTASAHAPSVRSASAHAHATAPTAHPAAANYAPAAVQHYEAPVDSADVDPVEQVREATLTPLASSEIKAAFAQFQAPAAPTAGATDAMGSELKTLRRMLETQLAHLAWNDLSRRAPVHTEILRELTEIGITQDLAEHLARQLPEDTDITFARRFTIAGLSQYLKVTGDHWLDDGGRVAFAGATGVGKTTTLAKIAVRWVLRHGPRDIALIAGDSVRIGAQDQLQSLAQLLGVPVYTPEKFESLPSLLSSLNERLILIDTPGSSVRDPQLANRLAVLSNAASKLETALVLAASTQAGAIEESVKHFAPANPSCCVLTKLDEAASLGGVLSVLIRARLPVSYMSEGQRVPEDLRPARALELVSAAVRLAKARGAAADEDLLRRRFGKTAHGIS